MRSRKQKKIQQHKKVKVNPKVSAMKQAVSRDWSRGLEDFTRGVSREKKK